MLWYVIFVCIDNKMMIVNGNLYCFVLLELNKMLKFTMFYLHWFAEKSQELRIT